MGKREIVAYERIRDLKMSENRGLKDECHRVFQLRGPKGGLCVGFSEQAPSGVPRFDTIRFCVLNREDIEKMKEDAGICSRRTAHCMTGEEAMRLGASLIQAAGFYTATVDQSLKEGFYADKWEAPKTRNKEVEQ